MDLVQCAAEKTRGGRCSRNGLNAVTTTHWLCSQHMSRAGYEAIRLFDGTRYQQPVHHKAAVPLLPPPIPQAAGGPAPQKEDIFHDNQSVHRAWVVDQIKANMKAIDAFYKGADFKDVHAACNQLLHEIGSIVYRGRRAATPNTALQRNASISLENLHFLCANPWGGFTSEDMTQYCAAVFRGILQLSAKADGTTDATVKEQLLGEFCEWVASKDSYCTSGIMDSGMQFFLGRIEGVGMKVPAHELVGGRLAKLRDDLAKMFPADEDEVALQGLFADQAKDILREYEVPEAEWGSWLVL
jgi:hypothetical protein